MPDLFAPKTPEDVARLIAQYPLAWVIGADFKATPLPLMAETDSSGSVTALIGHFARRNPQVPALQGNPHALVLFQGPQGYISPRLVSKPAWGPTWNYAVARFEVRVEFIGEEMDQHILAMAAHLESHRADPWVPSEMGPRYADLRRYIIGFRAHVQAAHFTFKLGQDEDAATFAEITRGLGGNPLAQWMLNQRDTPPQGQK
jgi:transcriptional regulator